MKKKIGIVTTAVLYFGFLVYTMYMKIKQNGVTENLLKIALVVSAFALCGYYLYFYSQIQVNKRHVSGTANLKELEISKRRIIADKIGGILFIVLGVIFMIFTLI